MNRNRIFRQLNSVIVALIFLAGCATSHFGTSPDRLDGFPERRISAAEAVDAAEPYLDETWKKMRANRASDWPSQDPIIRVKLQRGFYYVLKDDYPLKNASYGFDCAVKVNATTGEVTAPKSH